MGSVDLASSDKKLPNFVSFSFIFLFFFFVGVVCVSELDRFYRVGGVRKGLFSCSEKCHKMIYLSKDLPRGTYDMGVYFFRCFTSLRLITCTVTWLF